MSIKIYSSIWMCLKIVPISNSQSASSLDTSVSEVINKNEMGKMQCLVNDINTWCMKNEMKLNQTKCKDMIISFALEHPKLDPIFIEEHELVPVSSAKILGMYISVDLKWNTHITHIVSKASKRLYFLRLLKRSGVDRYSLLTVFTTCIRPVLEYGCQAWSYGITQYLNTFQMKLNVSKSEP